MTLAEVLELMKVRPAGQPLDLSGLLSTLTQHQAPPVSDNGEFASWAMGQHQKGLAAGKEGATPHQAAGGQLEMPKPVNLSGLLPKWSPIDPESQVPQMPRLRLPEQSAPPMRPAPIPEAQPFVNLTPEQYQPQRYLFLNAAPPRGLL
jgi:hypothetical protein